jgi:hypothetical protein
MRSSVVPVLMAAVLGCNLLCAAEPGKAELTPEACKKALLEMMRSKPGQALGFFDKKLVDEMEKIPIEKKKDEYHWTGAYRFLPRESNVCAFRVPERRSTTPSASSKGVFDSPARVSGFL